MICVLSLSPRSTRHRSKETDPEVGQLLKDFGVSEAEKRLWSGSTKRVASAVGEGAMAVQFVEEYLKECRSA